MGQISKFLVIVIIIIAIIGFIVTRQNSKASVLPVLTNTNDFEVIADNLKIPWEIVFLPDGEILVTERPESLYFVKAKQRITVPDVASTGEGGLLGAAIHPDFKKNQWIYLYLTKKINNQLTNRVVRYKLINNNLSDFKVIYGGILAANNHDGGRIAFGPDGFLYITTGDAQRPELAQSTNLTVGKILRLTDEGKVPSDNPFGNAVYSYGHRNPQGLAWDSNGDLWATEHGRSGVLSGFDELNQIKKGGNYGWPVIQGDEEREGMMPPFVHSGADKTWAPAGLAYFHGKFYFAGLRGEAIYEYDPDTNKIKEFINGKFGRLRALVIGPDGYFYITTSNTDGRGAVKPGDDKLLKIDPKTL